MSRRTSIVKALAEKLKGIDGTTGKYLSNIYGNAYSYMKYWDEVNDFPCIYMTNGTEVREYHPGGFAWGYLNVSLKVYCKGEDSSQQLEEVLEDMENVINANRALVYDTTTGDETTEMLITAITTDEGLLVPYAIGEMNLQIRYAVT
jgi:hypothetical protein